MDLLDIVDIHPVSLFKCRLDSLDFLDMLENERQK